MPQEWEMWLTLNVISKTLIQSLYQSLGKEEEEEEECAFQKNIEPFCTQK